ncbi:MAG: type II toxin-antitoxin system PemK/MazF family toxin [Planctomycetes bacterium]|nr:type II toxin-antitoxin system PemK/MazF family toxin [Planctomycetota bacterium]
MVVVNVPFRGQTGSKPRPALVVSTARFHRHLLDMLVCPISSQPLYFERPGPGDRPLRHWKTVGLRHPSTARISNLLAVEKKLIRRILGIVHNDDLAGVMEGLRDAFGLGP